MVEDGNELVPGGNVGGCGDVACGDVSWVGGGGEPFGVWWRWVGGDVRGEFDEVGAVVVAEEVADVVFVEVEVDFEVSRMIADFDEVENAEVFGGVGDVVSEVGIRLKFFSEHEVG